MSVQAGIWNFQGEPVDRQFLARISQSIAEYAPDGETTYFDGPLGMLYRPFYSTMESRAERQPYISVSGKVITWDGRLDNRDELMTQLRSHPPDDRTDVAIVAAAFERWGMDCFAKLIGDWGLSIWDPREKELILSRDYIGIRHLFYYPKRDKIIWCNHLAPLALCGDQFTLCDEYIAGYLASWPATHLTPYQEIRSVPPGKFVCICNGQTAIHTYWTFDTRLRTRYKTDHEYEEQYRHLFRQAVRRRMRTDSPILADLSGGFDSSSIVCMADDILSKEGAETPSIDTFSFHDSTEPEDDDLFYFTRIEEKRGKTGFHADLKSFDTSVSFDNQKFVGFPDIRLRTQVTAALSAILERHKHRVRLSGSAGDDVNGQGLDPRIQMADLLLRLRFIELAKQLTTWSLLIRKRPWIHLFFQTLRELMPVQVRARFTDHAKVDAWINRAFATKFSISAHQMGAVKESSFVRPSTRNSLETFISVSRQMSCTAPSITEIWYPYLDQNLVEFLKSVPLDQLLRPGQRRSLMRRALKDLLPPEVLTRKTKAAPGRCFSVALDKYWNEVELIFSSPFISRLGYVERDRIHEALVAVKNGNLPEYISRFLKTFSLELWLRDAESCGVISTPPPRALNADRSLAGTGTRFKNRLEPKPESIALTTLASGVANSEKERR